MSKRAQLGRLLTDASLDSALRACGLFSKDGWQQGANIELDLESVEYVEFGAAARLLCVIEGAARAASEVLITLPSAERRDDEERFLVDGIRDIDEAYRHVVARRTRDRAEARRKSRSFLRHIGFFGALRLDHLPPPFRTRVLVIDNSERVDLGDPTPTADGGVVGGYSVQSFPAILPLRWLDSSALVKDDWQHEAIRFLYDGGLVMTWDDADSLVTTVIRELVDNVSDHAVDGLSATPGALFGALTLNRRLSRWYPDVGRFYPYISPYIAWLSEQRSPIVRIVVADSGQGLTTSLFPRYMRQSAKRVSRATTDDKRGCIQFSFEPQASRHDAGPRRGVGLTAVRRFVRAYRGSVSVRTANVVAGFECRAPRPTFEADSGGLPYAPGTSVEIFLGLTLRARERQERFGGLAVGSATLVPSFADISENSRTVLYRLHRELDAANAEHPIVVLQVREWARERDARENFASELAQLAFSLYGIAGLTVVIEAASDADCEATFSAEDEMREATAGGRGDAHLQWTPPFLVVSASGRPQWSGATRDLRRVMFDLLEGARKQRNSAELATLDTRGQEYLRSERDWIAVDEDDRLGLRVTLESVDDAVARSVASRLANRFERLIPAVTV